jgi:DNA polymerase III subunit gamma/tau
LNAAPAAPRPATPARPPAPVVTSFADELDDGGSVPPWEDLPPEADGSYVDEDTAPPPPRFNLNPRSFHELVELVGQKRDAKMRIHLEEHVSLLKFELGADMCQVELKLLDGAPHNLVGELGDKLTKWTGRRWLIVVGRGQGERPIGDVRREAEAKQLAEVKAHPAVAAVLRIFPEVEVKTVKPLPGMAGAKKREG